MNEPIHRGVFFIHRDVLSHSPQRFPERAGWSAKCRAHGCGFSSKITIFVVNMKIFGIGMNYAEHNIELGETLFCKILLI